MQEINESVKRKPTAEGLAVTGQLLVPHSLDLALTSFENALDIDPLNLDVIGSMRTLESQLDPTVRLQLASRLRSRLDDTDGGPDLNNRLLSLAAANDQPELLREVMERMNRTRTPVPAPGGGASPDVAVVVPLHNQGRYLREALDSLRAQSYTNWECVVIDDGSTDDSGGIAENLVQEYSDPRIRVIHQRNSERSATRNRGVEETSGRFIVCLDADDSLAPGYLEAARRALLSEPDLGWVYPVVLQYGEINRYWSIWPFDPWRLLTHNICLPSSMERREMFEETGGYVTTMNLYEDWEHWIHGMSLGWRARRIDMIGKFYRKPPDSTMAQVRKEKEFEAKLELIGRHFEFYRPLGSNERALLAKYPRIHPSLVRPGVTATWQLRNMTLRSRILSTADIV
jgi:hypothetical protein